MSKKRRAPAKKRSKPKKSAARSVRAKGPKVRTPARASRAGRSPRSGGSASRAAPGDNSRAGQFATFEEAKSAAIDGLIRVIEESERRLSAVKRAATYGELKKLTGPAA